MAFQTKVYFVQKCERDGTPKEVIAVKLTFTAAHQIAKKYAPCKVGWTIADKSDVPNKPEYY